MQAEPEALRMIGLAGNIHAALKGAGRGGLPLVPGRPRRASSTVMVTGCRVAKVVIVSVPLAMGVDPGDDFWPDVCACLAPDHYSEMLQPNPNLAWIRMIRTSVADIASIQGLTEVSGATSSAMVTTASAGTDRLEGLTTFRRPSRFLDKSGSRNKATG